jgi:hypothetical protein
MGSAQLKIEKLTRDQLTNITKKPVEDLKKRKVIQYVININEPDKPPVSGKLSEESKLFVDKFSASGMTPRNTEYILLTANNDYMGYVRQKPKEPNIYNIYVAAVLGTTEDIEAVVQPVRQYFTVSLDDSGRASLIRRLFDKL